MFKRQSRNQQCTVIPSDRPTMLSAANHLVDLFHVKMAGDFDSELSTIEQTAYDSALDYLTRQFRIGHTDPETVKVLDYVDFQQ